MKILVLHNLYGRLQKGGAEMAVKDLGQGLISLGHQVSIVSSSPEPIEDQNSEDEGLKHYEIKSSYYNLSDFSNARRIFWHLSQFIAIGKYRKIKRICRLEKPDLIITNNLMGLGWLAEFALASSDRPIIHVIHDLQLIYPSGLLYYGQEDRLEAPTMKMYQKAMSFLTSPVSAVISPSRWLIDLHLKHGLFQRKPSAVIANPMPDIKERDEKENDSDTLKLLFAGQLEIHKGILFLIDSLASTDIRDVLEGTRFNKIELTIAGSGSLSEQISGLEKDTDALSVQAIGKQDRDRLIGIMKESDILIFPSLCYENSPMTIKEASLSGAEVIASNIGGIGEMLPESNLFTPADKESLINALTKAAIRIEKGLGTKASPSPDSISYAEAIIDFSKSLL